MNRFPWLVALIPACHGLSTFEVEGEATAVVEQGTILEELFGDLGFDDWLDLQITDTQQFRNQGAAPGDMEDVRLRSLELEATAPEGGDLSFL